MGDAIHEALLSTSKSSTQWSACLWDYNSGNALRTYRNTGPATAKTLNQLGNDYVLFAEQTKPLVHVFPVNSQDKLKNFRTILPEPANVVTVCPNNVYLAVGLGAKLYVWQLTSGKLLAVQQKHFQAITCIKFANTGDFLVVAGQDGMLVTYNFGDLVSLQTNYLPQSELGQVEPLYTRMDHTMPIHDSHVGDFGFRSRIATVSSDHTCRIYGLLKGDPLLTLVFDEPLTSVIFDAPCWDLFVGTNSGPIRQFKLTDPPRTLQHHVDGTEKEKLSFIGHEKRINCLALNVTSGILASGSDDCKLLIWEVRSRQILRAIEHKDSVTNVRFTFNHVNFHAQNLKPICTLKTLERNVDLNSRNVTVSIVQNEDILFSDEEDGEREGGKEKELQRKLEEALGINNQLYETMVRMSNKYYGEKK